jgi:polyisoprenoid-binding protein YceI
MRMIALVLALFAAACANLEPARAQTAQSERYTLDPAHTQVAFSIERFGFNYVLGRFDAVSGEVSLDQARPANSSVIATIQTASVSSGNPTRDEHLRAPRWLDAAQFPTMEFRSTSVRQTGPESAEVTGDLTLHGATHLVVLTVTLNQLGALPNNQQPGAGFSATGVISRSQFGMTTATNLIGDEVRITIEALGQAAVAPAP